MNQHQKDRFAQNVVRSLFNTVADKKLAIFGFAFKKNTNDTRESPAISIAQTLLQEHANLAIYDPQVTDSQIFEAIGSEYARNRVVVFNDPYDAAEHAHAVIIATEWDEFQNLDYTRIYNTMPKPAFIFDGRNLLDLGQLQNIGFKVYGIGQGDFVAKRNKKVVSL